MGNRINKTRSNNKNDDKLEYNQEAQNYSSQFSLSSFTSNRFNLSFRGSQRAYSQSSRPWSRVSRRKFNDITLADPLSLSKTCWPVPYIESIFLPHFTVNHDDIHHKYIVLDNLACGAFGKVYHIAEKKAEKEFALKVISKSQIIKNGTLQQIKDEVDIQTICGHHPFIVECISFWQNRKEIFLLSEYIPCGELFDKIQEFSYQLIQLYVAEIAIAVEFLHNAGVIYRDLKPENILLDSRYHIKLTDFGLSKWLKFGNRTYTICGTLQYMAPEVLVGDGYSHSADWWSLGVVACRMMTHKYPVLVENVAAPENDLPLSEHEHESQSNGTNKDIANKMATTTDNKTKDVELFKNKIVKLPGELSAMPPAYKDLLQRLLEINPKHRIKSILGLERIAFYKNFSFDGAREKKINPTDFINFASPTQYYNDMLPATLADFT